MKPKADKPVKAKAPTMKLAAKTKESSHLHMTLEFLFWKGNDIGFYLNKLRLVAQLKPEKSTRNSGLAVLGAVVHNKIHVHGHKWHEEFKQTLLKSFIDLIKMVQTNVKEREDRWV